MSVKTLTSALLAVLLGLHSAGVSETLPGGPPPQGTERQKQVVQHLFDFLDQKEGALEAFEAEWEMSLAPMVVETLRFFAPRQEILFDDETPAGKLWDLLERKTGQDVDRDLYPMMEWVWEQDFEMHPFYPAFKAEIHAPIDERFHWWFYPGMKHTIRLDEIVWGGVKVDGIPPLEHPRFIEADEAAYLEGTDVIFGVYLNGEAKAYPKRILAWHELFNDTVGGMDVTCAYCTLCGSAVLYDQRIGKRQFDFGTSGFLFRSNKLMYDRQTRSLWSALEGVPVTGKLVESELKLKRLPIVTTTWSAWRKSHPRTRVLSLETGHRRDYGEGVAYRAYFATQELMFPVRYRDSRLNNKQEVVALLLEGEAVAYDTDFLGENPLYQDRVGKQALVILVPSSRVAGCRIARKLSGTERHSMRAGRPRSRVGAASHHSCSSRGAPPCRAAVLPMRQNRPASWPFVDNFFRLFQSGSDFRGKPQGAGCRLICSINSAALASSRSLSLPYCSRAKALSPTARWASPR